MRGGKKLIGVAGAADQRARRRRSHVESAGGGAEKYGGGLTGDVNSDGQVSGARRLLIFIMENDGGRAVGW